MVSAKKDFNNQADRKICSADTSKFLSPVTCQLPSGAMKKVVIMAGMEVMPGLSNMDLHSLDYHSSICQQPRPRPSPQYGIIPRGHQSATWGQADPAPWTASIMEGAVSCFCLNKHLFWIQMCLSCTQGFCQNYY